MKELLVGSKVTKRFGGLVALKDIDFTIGEGEIVGLIGPNGSGKTTLFNCIGGTYHPTRGSIKFKGKEISKLKPDKVCRLGIGRTFQIVAPFMTFPIIDNVSVAVLYGKGKHISIEEARREALHILEFVGLSKKKNHLPLELTIADLKHLEMARALATQSDLILIDECVAGLTPTETFEAIKLIRKIRNNLGVTVFWIEHVMRAIMEACDRIIVLNYGERIAEGEPKEIVKNEDVIKAYLGEPRK